MKFKTLGAAYLGANEQANHIIAKIISSLEITPEEGELLADLLQGDLEAKTKLNNLIKDLLGKSQEEVFAEDGKLILEDLRIRDRLVRNDNEFFEVEKYLGNNSACCKNEVAFRLSSIDRANNKIVITCCRTEDDHLEITDFSRHIPYPKLEEN